MKRKFHELNLYSYIFYRHLENTIILTWKILILASFSMILDSDLGFQNRFSGKCTRFFWVANLSAEPSEFLLQITNLLMIRKTTIIRHKNI